MPLINVPVGIAPCQIDDFPKTVGKGEGAKPFERSCKGALFLRPASSKVVTQDELDWIKQHPEHKLLARRLTVVRVDVVTDESDRSLAKITDEQKAKAKAKAEMREKGKALPMTGPRAEKAAKAAAEAKAKATGKPAEPKPEAPKPPEPAPSSSSSDDESSGEGSSRSSRRRGRG